ncbi:MAG: agmatinase [bacterium]|nr:agmatinase [bacterium]
MSLIAPSQGFLANTIVWAEADAVIFGAPMDFTVSFRPGSRLGPQRIREVSYGIEEYSMFLNDSLFDRRYYDAGDLGLPIGNVNESLAVIYQATSTILSAGKFPICLGGEHLVTWPIIQAMYEKYPDLAIVHFDAHADLRQDYLGEPNSHATVMRRAAELIGPENLYQFGIRSGSREERIYADENTNIYYAQVHPALADVLPSLANRPIYVSLDIDIVDPAFAPGTGTPEPGGFTSSDILKAIHLLRFSQVVGFDLVEVLPSLDLSQITSILAAKLVREAIIGFLPKRTE